MAFANYATRLKEGEGLGTVQSRALFADYNRQEWTVMLLGARSLPPRQPHHSERVSVYCTNSVQYLKLVSPLIIYCFLILCMPSISTLKPYLRTQTIYLLLIFRTLWIQNSQVQYRDLEDK